jgi:hypothetical protein
MKENINVIYPFIMEHSFFGCLWRERVYEVIIYNFKQDSFSFYIYTPL